MSDFARRQLQKYGWTEGKGLGKLEDGISAPIKPSLKFDKCGIGHDSVKDATSGWWVHAFDDAASKIAVTDSETGTLVSVKMKESKNQEKCESSKYGSFVKKGVLDHEECKAEDVDIVKESSSSKSSWVTDEELFSACNGRTAHRAARFGLSMSGKMKRLQDQERSFYKNSSNSKVSSLNHRRIVKNLAESISDNLQIKKTKRTKEKNSKQS